MKQTCSTLPYSVRLPGNGREANPTLDGNMRDHAAIDQLLVLANLESMNAEFIHMNLPQGERLKRLNQIAIRQMQTLAGYAGIRRLPR